MVSVIWIFPGSQQVCTYYRLLSDSSQINSGHWLMWLYAGIDSSHPYSINLQHPPPTTRENTLNHSGKIIFYIPIFVAQCPHAINSFTALASATGEEENVVHFQEPSVYNPKNVWDKGYVNIKWDTGRKCRQHFSQPEERSIFRLYNQSKIV